MAEEHGFSRSAVRPDREVSKGTYGLASQIRRAGVSVPPNISEGAARSVEQFKNFLAIAIGSLNEVSTRLEIASRIGYIGNSEHDHAQSLVDECLALTYGLKKKFGVEH